MLSPDKQFAGKLVPAVEAGRPPDLTFGMSIDAHYAEWAFKGSARGPHDLTDAIGHFSDLFDPDAHMVDAALDRRAAPSHP